MDGNRLSELYKLRFSTEELSRKNQIWKTLCSNFFQEFINPNSTVVDIACGYGEFLNNIVCEKKIAVDLNPEAKEYLNEGIEFHNCSATNLGAVVKGTADIVFTSNFLEHLPNKAILDEFLDQVLIALKSGGKYLILGPNLRYLRSQYWDFYDHHLGLTDQSLSEALRLKGFDIELCIKRFLPFSTQGALPTHPMLVKLYLSFPIFWPILGKQFFIIAQKK